MIKRVLFIFILLPFTVLSQNMQTLREQAKTYYEKGDFLESYQTLNKIKDKETLENTNVNLYKTHLENIMQYRFFKKTKLNDSLYKVYIKSSVLKSQGIYNEKSKKYTLPPVYDSIPFNERYFKYKSVYKNKQEALVNIETGKVIVPLGNHSSIFYGDYILSTENTKNLFSYDDIITVLDLNGNVLFKDMDTFNFVYYPNYIRTKNKNNKYQIINIKTQKVIVDDIDQFFDTSGGIVQNESVPDNIWLPFRKNGQYYLYEITPNGIIDPHKFDTFIPLYANYNYFDNAITKLINSKDNAPFVLDSTKASFFSNYTIVKRDNKFGIYNISKDKYYKEPVYDSINKFGNTFYNGKWINLIYGEEICPPDFDKPVAIVFKKNNLFGLMDLSGKIITKADYDEIRFLWNDVFILRKGQKWGFTGVQKGDKLISPQFNNIEYLSGDFGNIACYKNKKAIKFLRNGEKPDLKAQNNRKLKNYISFENSISITNMNDYARVNDFDRNVFEKNGKFGLDDFDYNEVLPPTYSKIQFAKHNTFIAFRGSKVGLIDHNGKEIIPVKCAKIEYRDPFSDLFYVTFENGLQSIFNSKGREIYPANIKEITNSYFDIKTKTDYVFATEFLPVVENNNSEKQEKSYINVILKTKDDKVEKLKLKGYSFEFLSSNFIASKEGKLIVYNLKNGKIIDNLHGEIINDYGNNRLFGSKAHYYDTVIDSLSNEVTLEHPFYEIKNDNYFFKEENKIGVMNKNLQAANFRYPVLKNLNDDYRKIYPYPSNEYCEKASSYFRFNSNSTSVKNGIINFEGTVIIEPEIYDDIKLAYFPEMNKSQYSFFPENEFLKQYKSDLFACTNNGKENKTVHIISSQKEIIAAFELKNKENWNFSANNGAIIIRSADSIKLYDLKSKKILLNIKANQFQDDKDSGYTASYIDNKTTQDKYVKYDCKGQMIFDTIVTKNQPYYGSFNENYILKKNNKYGTVNAKGKPGIPYVYDYLESKNGKLFISKSNDLFGIINEDNLTIIDKKYQDIKGGEIKDRNSDYTIGFSGYKVKEKNKFGLLDANTRTLLPTEFDELKLSRTIITAKKDSVVSVYDYTFKESFSAAVDSVDMDNNNMYHLYKNGKLFYIDFDGNIKDKNPYMSWEDWLKLTYSKEIDGKYYLSQNGNLLHKTPVVSFKIVDQTIDFMGERLEYLLIQDQDGFYGLYTKDLKQILPFLYEEIIIVPNEDFYIIKKAGKYGVINSQKQTVIPYKYDNISFYKGIYYCKKNKKTDHLTLAIDN